MRTRTLVFAAAMAAVLTGCFDSTVDSDYSPGLDDNSAPPSPSTYAVGGDVSGTIANVTVNKIGGLTSAQLSNGLGSLATATDLSTPSTLVMRDAAGSFAANTIDATLFRGTLQGAADTAGEAVFALGQRIDNFSINPVPGAFAGGTSFRVTSQSANLTGATMPTANVGTMVTMTFPTVSVTMVPGPTFQLKDNLRYKTALNGNDTFLFLKTSDTPLLWTEVSRTVQPSRVLASRANLVDYNDIGLDTRTVVWDQEDMDLLGEYDDTTGEFQAAQGGNYEFNINVGTNRSDWTNGDYCRIDLRVNGVVVSQNILYPPQLAGGMRTSCRVRLVTTQELLPNDIVQVDFTTSRAAVGVGVTIPASEALLQRMEIRRK